MLLKWSCSSIEFAELCSHHRRLFLTRQKKWPKRPKKLSSWLAVENKDVSVTLTLIYFYIMGLLKDKKKMLQMKVETQTSEMELANL